MSEDLAPFKQLIKAHCGLQLEGLAEERLRKALQAATLATGVGQLPALLARLKKEPELVKDLVSHLTVNETYFFREKSQLDLLVAALLPRLQQLKSPGQPIKLLSAGCSSGEEPYSLVMALEESFGQAAQQQFQVEAGDLDYQILNKARKGVYSPFSFRGLSADLRSKYFQPQGSHFQLIESIRKQVVFHELNLLAPRFSSNLGCFDVVFFRNVSIYFDVETRLEILRNLYELMSDEAFLVVGSSETLANDLGIFKLVEEQGNYYFVKGTRLLPGAPEQQKLKPQQSKSRSVNPIPQPIKKPLIATQAQAQEALPSAAMIYQLLLNDDTQLANRQLDRLLKAGQELSAARVMKAWLLSNRGEFEQALESLKAQLEETPWFLDAVFLKALIYKWQGKEQEAIASFRKAIYIQPDCWPAHFYLAEIQRLTQQLDSAISAYQTARRLLSQQQPATGLQWLPLQLSQADLLFLIEHQLLRLGRQQAASAEGGS